MCFSIATSSQYPEVVFLGTGSAIPMKIRNVSSTLVNIRYEPLKGGAARGGTLPHSQVNQKVQPLIPGGQSWLECPGRGRAVR